MRLALLLCFLISFSAFGQTSQLSGTVSDSETGEALIGATLLIGSTGTVTDYNGNYSIDLKDGQYSVVVSYVGYEPYEEEIQLSKSPFTLNVSLRSSQFLKEIVVTADIARERETPVAFSNIPTLKLEEELAAQDIPMVLNSTPGAYATQSGGGDGDARVTIRGFNQRNVSVMLNGIPVNDMENGWVYWSNWFGLDLVTKTMQVQRGLGASKIATPSVGGTINILTKGIDAKRSMRLKQEVGNNGFLRSTLGFTSGRLDNGWGFSVAGSYKRGDGWVDGNFTEGYFYYGRIDKEFNKHTFSLTGFGAPQKHGQRSFMMHISEWDSDFAADQNVPDSIAYRPDVTDNGLRYNQHLGELDGEEYNTRQNYYHKPQISFRHSWAPTPKFFWSNVSYLSIGNGGGTAPIGSVNTRKENGLLDLDAAVEHNQTETIFKPDTRSEKIIRASVNNHFWYGLLSTFRYDATDKVAVSGGADLRRYRGDHYREVRDLLGGSYFRSEGNTLIDEANSRLVVGDKWDYDNSGFVRWAGVFGLVEYKNPNYSLFLNLSASSTGYKLVDHFKPMNVALADTTFNVAYGDVVLHNGTDYTINSPEAKKQETGWIDIPGFTAKIGANYKLTEELNAFVNLGYLSKAQRFGNVINSNRNDSSLPLVEFDNYDNELVQAIEFGTSYANEFIAANLNAYRTEWKNKPLDRTLTVQNPDNPTDPDDRIPVNVSGIDALHLGVEFDVAIQIMDNLKLETLLSIGDWKWNSEALVTLPDGSTFGFNAVDVPVGDAAQFQSGASLRYEPIKGLYIKPKWNFFDRNYANFNPSSLGTENLDDPTRIPWQMPKYSLVDLHLGYGFSLGGKKARLRLNILNVLDEKYISDAFNNDGFSGIGSDSSANSAGVFFGQGRRWTTSFDITF